MRILLELVNQTDHSQNQREEEIAVVARVLHVFRHVLRSEAGLIDELYAGNPVAGALSAEPLVNCLASDKVPHEIAAVHVAHLVFEEEFQILSEGGCARHALASDVLVFVTDVRPNLVLADARTFAVPHAGEECAVVAVIDNFGILAVVTDHIFAADGQFSVGIFFLVLIHEFPGILLLEE